MGCPLFQFFALVVRIERIFTFMAFYTMMCYTY